MPMTVDLLDDLFDLPDADAGMNPDLAAWAKEHGDQAETPAPLRPINGPCGVCSNRATTRCLRCERPVCSRHHHVMVGMCDRCTDASTKEREEADGSVHDTTGGPFGDERPRRHAELDLDWIE